MMDLTIGGYLRRLRDISDQFVRFGAAALAQRRRARDGGGPPSVEELLDNPSRIDELMASAMHRLSMLGTSVGSTAARIAEAVRRGLVGRDRVALAFELADAEVDEPSGDAT